MRGFRRLPRSARCIVTVVGVLALVAAGCGDDDDDDTSSTSTAAGAETTAEDGGESATARGVSADSIRVGGLGQVDFFPGMEEGAQARFERANAEGGVAGRMIDYIGLQDDGGDSTANLDLARNMVENDEVFAIIPATSAVMLPATTDYLNENGVPFVGWGFQPGFCVPDSVGYGFNGCLIGAAAGVPEPVSSEALSEPIADFLDDPDYTVAILNSDDDSGHGAAPQYEQLFGDRLLYQDFVPTSGVTDYSPYINGVLDTDADAAIVACDSACTLAVKPAILGGGFEGPIVDYANYIPGILADPAVAGALEGTYVNTQLPPQEGGGPAIEQLVADLEAIGADPLVTTGVSVGYWSADMFLQMLESVGTDLNAQTFRETINAGFEYEPPEGGLGPISFPDGFQQPSPCAALVGVEDAEYVLAVPFTCYGVIPAE